MRFRKSRWFTIGTICLAGGLSIQQAMWLNATTYVIPLSRCSSTQIPWLNGPCRCYQLNGVFLDSCEMAVVDPGDPASMSISACYHDPSLTCTTWDTSCGFVVRMSRACDQAGTRTVVETFPEKPPCDGSSGKCIDDGVPPGHFP